MKKENEKVNFDLSVLNLKELVTVYEEITDFIKLLEDKKIVTEKVEDENE